VLIAVRDDRVEGFQYGKEVVYPFSAIRDATYHSTRNSAYLVLSLPSGTVRMEGQDFDATRRAADAVRARITARASGA
jgi:hypothetical protein